MPLLEVTQTRQVSASIRLNDTTALQVDQYAAFIRASADEVVEQALAYVFSKDRDFQDFLKLPEARRVASTLRVRRAPASDVLSARRWDGQGHQQTGLDCLEPRLHRKRKIEIRHRPR